VNKALLRTLSYVFGLGQFGDGTGQYVFDPVATSSAGRMAQGVDWQSDGITDISRMLTDMICEVKYLRDLARGLGFAQAELTFI
jgi:hypothetical protein